jgi:hypothetical protein
MSNSDILLVATLTQRVTDAFGAGPPTNQMGQIVGNPPRFVPFQWIEGQTFRVHTIIFSHDAGAAVRGRVEFGSFNGALIEVNGLAWEEALPDNTVAENVVVIGGNPNVTLFKLQPFARPAPIPAGATDNHDRLLASADPAGAVGDLIIKLIGRLET